MTKKHIQNADPRSPGVFYVRCKPWGSDPIDILINRKIVVFGYPIIDRERYDQHALRSCLADPSGSEADWAAALSRGDYDRKYRSQANKNRNMVRQVAKGDIVMVPRPKRGLVYCGRVDPGFELVDDPQWASDFSQLVLKHESFDIHASEMAQCWHVDELRAVSFPAIPAWIRGSLFGRSSYGWVKDVEGYDAHRVMSDVLDGKWSWSSAWTTDLAEIRRRLLSSVTPSTFEHLVVSLLQRDRPELMWMHVGGSGDGGVDAIGINDGGKVVGVVQCKLRMSSEEQGFKQADVGDTRELILASLLHPADYAPRDGITFYDGDAITRLVAKHASTLPYASSIRVGAAN